VTNCRIELGKKSGKWCRGDQNTSKRSFIAQRENVTWVLKGLNSFGNSSSLNVTDGYLDLSETSESE